jgi:3',5'-cyclic-AMP phosphodiesterase
MFLVFRLVAAFLILLSPAGSPASDPLRFAILGDRTGDAQPGIYEQVWKEVAAENPALVLSVGDTIEGMNDASAEEQWRQVLQILDPYRRFPLHLAPGNHDVWSPASEQLFRRQSMHPLQYGFDSGEAHFTILDNSRSDELSPQELAFLESDLKAHAAQPFKIIVSHRPSWLIHVATRNPDFPLHQLARRFGVQYVIAGHVHQMIHIDLDGVTYVSMPSSGGHLRLSKAYADGWFFGHALLELRAGGSRFQVKEIDEPRGRGRTTNLADWGMAGLLTRK